MIKTSNLKLNLIFIVFISLFAFAWIAFYNIQIINYSFYQETAEKQYYKYIKTLPDRGLIFDRNDVAIAINSECKSAFILPKQIKNRKKLDQFLQKYYPNAFYRLSKNERNYFIFIKRNLTEQDINLIKKEDIEDINFLCEPHRYYPIESCALITGMTDVDNNGLFAIELKFNEILSGKPIQMELEKDARSNNFYFAKKAINSGFLSESVKLTIDSNIQFLANEELKTSMEEFQTLSGAVIIMNPENGHILAMTSEPSLNPNERETIDTETTKNISICQSYEFGSIFKAFVALAAIEEGLITPDEEIDCLSSKSAYVDGRKINTTIANGVITATEVIKYSNNIGIAKIAKRLNEKLYDHYKLIGFGQKTGVILEGEQSGFINPPEKWSKQSIISLSYGYEITSTLLQLTTAFCLFSNDGYKITPQLILKPKIENIEKPKKIYTTDSINEMRKILNDTTSKNGTAKKANIPGYFIIGKTSTANLIVDGIYIPEKNLYGFFGCIEKGSYKRVIGCFLKESPKKDLYASTVAAPLFQRIAERIIIHEKAW